MDYKYIAYTDDLLTEVESQPVNLKAVFFTIGVILLPCLLWFGFHSISKKAQANATAVALTAQTQPTTMPSYVGPMPAVALVKPIVAPKWESIQVKQGDTLTKIFKRLGISEKESQAIFKTKEGAKVLMQLKVSSELRLLIDPASHQLQQLNYPLNDTDILQVTRHNDVFQTQVIHQKPQIQLVYATGAIEHSLAKSLQKAKLQSKINSQLISIFKDQVDFNKVHQGDRFHVLYEDATVNNKKIRSGDIVAAEVISQGKTYRAVRYSDGKGHMDFYTPEGLSLKKGFLRAPVNYTRISSGFSLNRYHPLMHRTRAHKAIDFSAPRGTPIKATGDGKVTFASRKGGYGNTVQIAHAGNRSTLYAHMLRFASGVRPGTSVHAGQVIGYVGSTGLSTGPHVHYEMRINGVHQNPLTVKLPGGTPLDHTAKARFIPQARSLMAQLQVNQSVRLASNDTHKQTGG